LPFYQVVISSICHFINLPFINQPFHQLTISSAYLLSILPFTNLQFHQLAMSIYLHIILPLHQPAIYKRAFLQFAIFQLDISPACHFINWPFINLLFYQIASLTTFKFGIVLFGQIGIL
jgi:hypothetical protein